MTNYAAVGLAVAISSFLSFARIGRLAPSPASFSLGLCLMIGGMALREWAVISLGPYFSPKVELRVGHSLVERGPYRLIRHPGFALRRRTRVRIRIPVDRVELGLHGFTQLPREFIGSLPLRPRQDAPTQE